MSNKSKPTPWQIISAILAAIASVFNSLKRSHDSAHESDPAEPDGL